MWGPGPGVALWLGDGRQSRGGSLAGHYAVPAQARWSNRKSLVPRLHLPNVWEVESGNEASQEMTYSDDVIAHHQRMV